MADGRDGRWSEWEGGERHGMGGREGADRGADAARMTDDDGRWDEREEDRPRPTKAKAAPKSRQMGAGRAGENVKPLHAALSDG